LMARLAKGKKVERKESRAASPPAGSWSIAPRAKSTDQ